MGSSGRLEAMFPPPVEVGLEFEDVASGGGTAGSEKARQDEGSKAACAQQQSYIQQAAQSWAKHWGCAAAACSWQVCADTMANSLPSLALACFLSASPTSSPLAPSIPAGAPALQVALHLPPGGLRCMGATGGPMWRGLGCLAPGGGGPIAPCCWGMGCPPCRCMGAGTDTSAASPKGLSARPPSCCCCCCCACAGTPP